MTTCSPVSAQSRRVGLVAGEGQLRADARIQRRPGHPLRHVRARRRRRRSLHRIHAARRRPGLVARTQWSRSMRSCARMGEYRPLVEIPHALSETARRYRFDDGIGEIGIIAPVSHPFCGHCSRIRITSDGKIRTCLFSVWDHDLHGQMRRGAIRRRIGGIHSRRGREERSAPPHRRTRFRARIADHGPHRRDRQHSAVSNQQLASTIGTSAL